MNRLKKLVLLTAFFCLSSVLSAFNAELKLNKHRVYIGEHIVVSLTVEDGSGEETVIPPESNAFYLESAGQSSQMSWINGKSNSSITYKYILVPEKEGDVLIAPFIIKSGKNQLKTKPVNIKIFPAEEQKEILRKQSAKARTGKKELWIEQELSAERVFVDQPVVLFLKIFLDSDLHLRDASYEMPDLKDFVTEKAEQERKKVRIGNKIYDLIEISQVIFPTKSGSLTIGESLFKASILERSRSNRTRRTSPFDLFEDSFFSNSMLGSYSTRPVEMISEKTVLDVVPLPKTDVPETFKGTVGNYSLGVEYSDTSKLKQGDALTITMNITGEGHIENVIEPTLLGLGNFRSFDAEVELKKDEDGLGGSKVFKKMVIPDKPGKCKLPDVSFSFFNHKTGKYTTLVQEGKVVNIHEAQAINSGQKLVNINGDKKLKRKTVDLKLTGEDIIFIKTAGKVIKNNQDPLATGLFFLFILLVFILVSILVFIEWKFKVDGKDNVKQRRIKAYAKFKKSYAEAYAKQKKDINQSLGKLDESFSAYFADKMNLPYGTWTAKEIVGKLQELNFSDEFLKNLEKTLTMMDMMRYGAVKAEATETIKVFKDLKNAALVIERQKI